MNRQFSEKFVSAAQGTCMSTQEVLNHLDAEDFDEDDLDWALIENEIFNCVCCGWWCEVSEECDKGFDEPVCTDCEDDY